jgi:hypothetical protein
MEGQTREDLVRCFREAHQQCGAGGTDPCDPDDDGGPLNDGFGYIPEDMAEAFVLPEGNTDDIRDPAIDFFVVNPCVSDVARPRTH